MTFKEAMAHYRAGTATDEERQLVEQELEKSQLIAEYLDAQWDENICVSATPTEEMNKVRKSLRKRNALIVLTSLVLVAALALATIFIGIPAAEGLYWDPRTTSYGTDITDLELMMAAYTELFCPDINLSGITAKKTGFATYDLTLRYWDKNRGGDNEFATGTIDQGELLLSTGFPKLCAMNIFERATYPFHHADPDHLENIPIKLNQLPEYVTVVAAVSFSTDKSIAELLDFNDSLINGQVGWAGIRTAPLDTQMLPLCGMDISQWGTVRVEANQDYPCFDMKATERTAQNLETHFKSLLRFSANQARNGTGIVVKNQTDGCYYTDTLNYVEENGIYSYGCYVVGNPITFLALIGSGAVSQIRIEDIWFSVS